MRRRYVQHACEELHTYTIYGLKKCFLPSAKGRKQRAASGLNCCAHLLLPTLLLKGPDCNNVKREKKKKKLTLYKEYKKDLTNYRLYSGSHTLHSAHLAVNAMVKLLSHFLCHCSERIFSFVCTSLLWAKMSRSSALQTQTARTQ